MPRWTQQEQECVDILKSRLKDELAASPQYPEVVGERKMVRFLRGHNFDVEKVYKMMVDFFKWRIDNNVNEIRTNIVERGFDHPLKFPKGEVILSLIPQLIIVPDALDKLGSPICVEQYNFTPSDVFKHINIDDYIHFVLYSLEYRSLVLEQMSEHRERTFLKGLSQEERVKLETDMSSKPYGVIVNTCVVRDLNGVGFAHLGAQGQDIIKAVITVASDNYPELMRKCFMINAPFIFNAVWYVIKGFMAPRTIAKVSMMGGGYMNELLQDIDYENLPAMVGGGYEGFVKYEPLAFDRLYFVPYYEPVNNSVSSHASSVKIGNEDGSVVDSVASADSEKSVGDYVVVGAAPSSSSGKNNNPTTDANATSAATTTNSNVTTPPSTSGSLGFCNTSDMSTYNDSGSVFMVITDMAGLETSETSFPTLHASGAIARTSIIHGTNWSKLAQCALDNGVINRSTRTALPAEEDFSMISFRTSGF